jgi:hypothetical protein
MKTAIRLAPIVLCSVLAACATKPAEPTKFALNGFSIAMDPKENWSLMQQTPERVMLAKPGDFTGETLSVLMTAPRVSAQDADSLQRHIRDSERQGLDTKRYRILRQDIGPQTAAGLSCARSLLEVEDRGAAGATGPVTSTITESITYVCPDPTRPGQAISVSYAHQSYPEDKGRLFLDKATPILNSLERTANP